MKKKYIRGEWYGCMVKPIKIVFLILQRFRFWNCDCLSRVELELTYRFYEFCLGSDFDSEIFGTRVSVSNLRFWPIWTFFGKSIKIRLLTIQLHWRVREYITYRSELDRIRAFTMGRRMRRSKPRPLHRHISILSSAPSTCNWADYSPPKASS